jgi:GxxExxY protein
MPTRSTLTPLIIGAAVEVHRTLGPGLLESAYKTCLGMELIERGLNIASERPLPNYHGRSAGLGYRLDLIVEDRVIVEVKSVGRLEPVHSAQLLSYLRLANKGVGLLFNFNVTVLTRDGLRRIFNRSCDPEMADTIIRP